MSPTPRRVERARRWTALLVASAVALLTACPPPPPPAPGASIRLIDAGARPEDVVAAVSSITGYHADVAAGLVRRAPVTLPGLTDARAREGARALEAVGAKVLVVPAPQPSSGQ